MTEFWPHKGQIVVVTGPSGTGKTTLIDMVRKRVEGIGYCVSHTTRTPRKGEVNGVHYHFVDRNDFKAKIKAHEFVEWAFVYGDLYGTSIASMERELSSGKDLLLDLDIRGAQAIKRKFSQAISIFIVPPSLKILKERLRGRSTENKRRLDQRTKNALEEISRCADYDFIVINDDVNRAASEVEAIVIAQRARKERRLTDVQRLFEI
jgi:guanylate kinase